MKTLKKSILFTCILISFSAILILLQTACTEEFFFDCVEGTGAEVTEARYVGDFDRIELNVDADVEFTQDEKTSISIEGQKNILDVLTTEKHGNSLVIGYEQCVVAHSKIIIHVTNQELNGIRLNGSGNFQCPGTISTTDFQAINSGSGNISIHSLSTNRLSTSINGSGRIDIHGNTIASEIVARINGSGDIRCDEFPAESAEVSIHGSGNCYVFPSDELNATIAGSGNIYYTGSPSINVHIVGSGQVIPF
jgi:hypothetical protein